MYVSMAHMHAGCHFDTYTRMLCILKEQFFILFQILKRKNNGMHRPNIATYNISFANNFMKWSNGVDICLSGLVIIYSRSCDKR